MWCYESTQGSGMKDGCMLKFDCIERYLMGLVQKLCLPGKSEYSWGTESSLKKYCW